MQVEHTEKKYMKISTEVKIKFYAPSKNLLISFFNNKCFININWNVKS